MSNGIYNHAQAGLNAYRLMEELSERPGSGGWVELHKTLRRAKPPDEREYPPVYKVVYKPGFWDRLTREFAEYVFAVADRYECEVSFGARRTATSVEFVIVFGHG